MIRTIDLAAWGNYVEEGYAVYRGIDHTSDACPAFLPINADDPDVSLLDFLHEQEDQESDYVLTGDSEEKQMSGWRTPTCCPSRSTSSRCCGPGRTRRGGSESSTRR